jgi:thioredoxin reductase
MYDAIIVGGGPAGLSAALILGRCRRRVLVCDSGQPRNAASRGLHGFLSRDGIQPAELLRIAREQLQPYGVEIRDVAVKDARCSADHFEVMLQDGSWMSSRKLILCTGMSDNIPEIQGIESLYGRSVFHCPYCDGWEVRDQPLAVYGSGQSGLQLALKLKIWSADIVLCTDGAAGLSLDDLQLLFTNHIQLRQERIAHLKGADGVLECITFSNGDSLRRRGLFLATGMEQRSDLAAKLGCALTSKGGVETHDFEKSGVPGLYIAGDASRDVQLAIVAAAEGAKAAFSINSELHNEQLLRPATGPTP